MIFSWWRKRRRRRILARPFPDEWEGHLGQVQLVEDLGSDDRTTLRAILQVLVAEKNWEGCGGLTMTDEIRVTVAAQAALLLLHIEHEYYRRVRSILVYPTTVVAPIRQAGPGGLAVEGRASILGVAQHRGPVVLAWDSAKIGGQNKSDGRNLVLHEFAHKLDMLDDFCDGTPPLENRQQYEAWTQVMTTEYERLVDSADRNRLTLLDKYGATNPAEFFAVATECFFEKPRALRRRRPELYETLKIYYRQDPARRREV